MKIVAIIECSSCCTLREVELEVNKDNHIPTCSCGEYYGDGGGVYRLTKIDPEKGEKN